MNKWDGFINDKTVCAGCGVKLLPGVPCLRGKRKKDRLPYCSKCAKGLVPNNT